MAATEAGSPRRLGLNLNLSVQPHAAAYHWPHSTVAEDTSPSRSKGCTDDDDDEDDEDDRDMDDRDMDDDDIMMDCRQDEDCSPEDEQDILEMQREERETLNQLARQLASGSRLITPMLQHLVYQHPGLSVQPSPIHQQQLQQQPSSVAVSLTTAALNRHATAAAADLSPKSSHSGDVPMSGGRSTEVQSPSAARNNEAQSWTFEEQFRQLYSAGSESDRRTFLDSLFSFMQEQGTPISRLPIMAKRVLDLYTLYKLVVQRGGIVAVITKKLWQEIIRGLGLPPSITSAAFTLRTQYVKYLYAYESRMNQFSTLDELNMAIAGNRREGRRNKSLMYSDMPPPPPGHPHHHHHGHHQQVHGGHQHPMMGGGGGAPPQSSPQQQQQQQQQQQHQQQQQPPSSHHHHHYANVLAAEDRFRHLAAAIIDNHHHAAAAAAAAAAAGVGVDHPRLRMQSCSPPQHQQQLQLQPECKTQSAVALHQTPRSPAAGLPPPPPMPPSSLFNGHQPPSFQHLHQQQQQQHQSNAVQSNSEQTNKQRELLSMLMWMDIVRANQTAMPRLPISSLPSSPSAAAAAAAAAYSAAAALNLTPAYKGQQQMSAAVVVPEQSEALNLGKKRMSNNNNSEDEDGGGDRPDDEYDRGRRESVKRIKTERSSPPVSGCSSDDEKAAAKATSNGSPSPPQPSSAAASDDVAYRSDTTRDSSPIDEDVVEMDINTSPSAGLSGNNGLAISVTRRTKNGVYMGQLTKNNALINGGLNNNANPFVLHLNGDLYTGQLQLQQQQMANN
ncbi:AT-rich interactive domain-containing protein 3A isoform X2 [Aphis gossypii]|nr:AT-rich interactive domain-containing protein 3A isoform X2 [Aphis gossypii]